jgi:two-component sensor histidine kinase
MRPAVLARIRERKAYGSANGRGKMSSLSELLPYRGAATERLLLREFSHRVKDQLAAAINLVTVAAGRCDSSEARAVLVAVLDRLPSHALVHRSLQMPDYDTTVDVAAYLQQLCRAISRAELAGEGIELLLSINPLRIRADRCWLLGMIVFELIADAARHRFADALDSSRDMAGRQLDRVLHFIRRNCRCRLAPKRRSRDS